MLIMWRWMVLLGSLQYAWSWEIEDSTDAMEYLNRFGYIGEDAASHMKLIDIGEVLKEFQHMAGINETGELDSNTIKMMNKPRCGNWDLNHEMIPDPISRTSGSLARVKRYKLSDTGRKWQKRELTYRITKFSDQNTIAEHLIERDVAEAFRIWEESTNLNFIKSKDTKVDIEVSFATAKHEDPFPFDGPGKTLAHAFSPGPGLGGDVHFDDHEKWTVDSPSGTNVLFVATHEIGHSLGLSHSDQKGAIMQAFYGGYRPHLKLNSDDIAGIQHLYGKRTTDTTVPVTPSPSPTTKTDRPLLFPTRATTSKYIPIVTQSATKKPVIKGNAPEICSKKKPIDAATTLSNGYILIFSGSNVYRLNENTKDVMADWPKNIESTFKGLEKNIDSAFTRKNGKTYFLKGGKYWRFSDFDMDAGYPKEMSKHFPGIPESIDSAFVHPTNEQIYITKGTEYWRFDPLAKGRPHVHSFYPLAIGLWGIGSDVKGLDASWTSPNGDIFFFKDSNYWKFDRHQFKVGSPELIHNTWFGCSKYLKQY